MGLFQKAIDAALITDYVKLTYLKTLATSIAKMAIAEFAYCGTMYKDALKTIEWKFGQPQAVNSSYWDKLSSFPPMNMHNSESMISSSATISTLVGIYWSLHYHQDLSSVSLLNQATHKLPHNLKEACSMHNVKKSWAYRQYLFTDCLKDNTEAHERMKLSSGKPRTEDSNPPLMPLKRRPEPKILRPLAPVKHRQRDTKTIDPLGKLLVKKNTPCGAVRCSAKRRLRNGQNWLQKTNSIFHNSVSNIRSANAQKHTSA